MLVLSYIKSGKSVSLTRLKWLICSWYPATYSRLERGETSIELENLVAFAKKLDIPIQEFLPDTISINNSTQKGQGQVVFGNIYYYNGNDTVKELTQEIENLKAEIRRMKGEDKE